MKRLDGDPAEEFLSLSATEALLFYQCMLELREQFHLRGDELRIRTGFSDEEIRAKMRELKPQLWSVFDLLR